MFDVLDQGHATLVTCHCDLCHEFLENVLPSCLRAAWPMPGMLLLPNIPWRPGGLLHLLMPAA